MSIPHDTQRGTSVTAFAALYLLVILTACGGTSPEGPPESGDRLQVVATTTIVADLISSVGEPDVEVVSLMGPGIDPHLYKPSAGDVRRMTEARAVFYNGLHLEGKMAEVLAEMGRRGVTTVAVAECLPEDSLLTVNAGAGLHDPHIWFDVELWMEAVRCALAALVDIDPTHADAHRQRATAYLEELAALDAEVHGRISSLPPERRVLVTAHDAFAYFGRAYGVEVRGLLGVSTASEASISDVQALADLIAEREVPALFVETSVPARYIEALQEAVAARGFEVAIGGSLYSDALGDPGSPAATYAGTVRANVDTIVSALAGVSRTIETGHDD